MPQYKIVRHYKEYSIDFLVNEIVSLIYLSKIFDFNNLDRVKKKYFSKKIGVISHFLCDYMCLPHKENMTFNNSFREHCKYEKDLNKFAKSHVFTENVIELEPIDLFEFEIVNLKQLVINYIDEVEKEYSKSESFERDLNFALNLSLNMSRFIIEVAEALAAEKDLRHSFVF